MAVTVTNYLKKKNSEGGSFLVLTIEGGVQMRQSQDTGNWFASSLKTNILANMDEASCRAMIGKELPGTIIKKKCPPYSFTIPSTGEERTLDYTFDYSPEED